MHAKPVIRGTRSPVELILRRLAEGASEEELLAAYRQLTREDIRAAIVYAADAVASQARVAIGSASSGGDAMTIATEHHYIVRDDNILNGEPIIRGTRTPVRAIVELWRLGVIPEEIPAHLPHLTYINRNQVPDDLTHPATRPDA